MSYDQVFKCFKCSENYNQSIRRPMIVCQNYHSICKACLSAICKEENKVYGCPICRARMTRRQAYFNGSFFQYRKFVREVIVIKQDLQNENRELIRQLDRQIQSTQRLQSDLSYQRQKNRQMNEEIKKLKINIKQAKLHNEQLGKNIKDINEQNIKLKQQVNSLELDKQITNLNFSDKIAQIQNKRRQQFKISIETALQYSKSQIRASYLQDQYDDLLQEKSYDKDKYRKRIQILRERCQSYKQNENKRCRQIRQLKEKLKNQSIQSSIY